MSRHLLIREIFEHYPRTFKGINHHGEHIVQITRREMAMYATLEKLSNQDLQSLADEVFTSTINHKIENV